MMSIEPRPVDVFFEEVRQRRREIAKDFGYDMIRLFDELKRRAAEHPERIVDPRKRAFSK